MNIHELVKATGVPERQVRYMVAEGFMPGPEPRVILKGSTGRHFHILVAYLGLAHSTAVKVMDSKSEVEASPTPDGRGVLVVNYKGDVRRYEPGDEEQ